MRTEPASDAHRTADPANPGPLELQHALAAIGADPESRATVVAACRAFEDLPERRGTAVRDQVTGPIVDALHGESPIVRKALSNGLVFEFLYRSRIARDFVLASPDPPDHVWEPQTTRLLLHLARGANHVIVGGAYFGDQAVLLAHQLQITGGVCHAFEPDPEQRRMLLRNAVLNRLDNISINASALWRNGVAHLELVGHDACASTRENAKPQRIGTVPATSLDQYLDNLAIGDVQLIALDVEGGEYPILQGAHARLSRPAGCAPHLVFEVHGAYVDWSQGLEETDICRYLRALGYTLFAIRDFQSNHAMNDRPIELIPPASAYLEGPLHGFNMVAVKEPDVLQGDWFRVRRGVSPKLLVHRDPALHHPLDEMP